VSVVESISTEASKQDELYQEISLSYCAALERLARAYEADQESYRDLLQEIHIALWRSLTGFDQRCSLRTWVYRVAHNVATSHVIQDRRAKSRTFVSLDALDVEPDRNDTESAADRQRALDRLLALIQLLNPIDRQVILLYLEGLDAASIGEITGISAGNVATKIHRIKNILVRRFHEGGRHDK
jgi:RNA polymerase sigma-70 factor (ECF subfamily)